VGLELQAESVELADMIMDILRLADKQATLFLLLDMEQEGRLVLVMRELMERVVLLAVVAEAEEGQKVIL
jgi:hypothetical protein